MGDILDPLQFAGHLFLLLLVFMIFLVFVDFIFFEFLLDFVYFFVEEASDVGFLFDEYF
jgi:hypothetical protein